MPDEPYDWSRRQNSVGDHNHTSDQIKNIDSGDTVSPTSETFVTELVTSETFITEVTENVEFVTNLTENETFIEQTVNEITAVEENNTYINQVTNNSTFVTNITQQINGNINGKKGAANELATLDSGQHLTPSQVPPALLARNLHFVIDGGDAVPSTGMKPGIRMPYACTITACEVFADASGSAVVDLKKTNYAGLPGSLASICASAKPTLSGAQKAQTTLTGWTTALVAGDWIIPNLDSISTCKFVEVVLAVTVTV